MLGCGMRMLLPQWQILNKKGCDACSKLSRGRRVMQWAACLYCIIHDVSAVIVEACARTQHVRS